jgi:hypothetical protein
MTALAQLKAELVQLQAEAVPLPLAEIEAAEAVPLPLAEIEARSCVCRLIENQRLTTLDEIGWYPR